MRHCHRAIRKKTKERSTLFWRYRDASDSISEPVDPMGIMIDAERRPAEQARRIPHELGKKRYLSQVSNIEAAREEHV